MRLLKRKHAEPESAAGEDRSEEEAAAEAVEDQPLYQQPRDEKGRYLSRKRM